LLAVVVGLVGLVVIPKILIRKVSKGSRAPVVGPVLAVRVVQMGMGAVAIRVVVGLVGAYIRMERVVFFQALMVKRLLTGGKGDQLAASVVVVGQIQLLVTLLGQVLLAVVVVAIRVAVVVGLLVTRGLASVVVAVPTMQAQTHLIPLGLIQAMAWSLFPTPLPVPNSQLHLPPAAS
jgi:hypothetical protein